MLLRTPAADELWRLHDMLAGLSALQIADPITEEVRGGGLPRERLHALARWLAENGTRRNAVAAGIVLLGVTGDEGDRGLLLLLGALEDLTLYAVVALSRTNTDRERAVFDLARRVYGWGRIHTVERLKGTQDPDIRAWLLRDGFRNGVMNEYLAHLAATTGDLYGALTYPDVDDALLDGAGEILEALFVGGPAQDMSDYPDGPAATERFVALVGSRPPTLARVSIVLRLSRALFSATGRTWEWSEQVRSRIAAECSRLVVQPVWRATVEEALDVEDLAAFRLAVWPAQELGIAVRDRVRARLRASPYDGYLWQCLTGDMDDVLALASELLPIDDLATGPSLDVGLASDNIDHVLDLLVSRLDDHPGKGWPLIRAALANRTIRNRNMAVRTLAAWPIEFVPDDAIDAVRHAARIEPDAKVRNGMQKLLSRLDHGAP